jgi:hypothetical protein
MNPSISQIQSEESENILNLVKFNLYLVQQTNRLF